MLGLPLASIDALAAAQPQFGEVRTQAPAMQVAPLVGRDIAFASSNGDLSVAHPNGTTTRILGGASAVDPVLSHDGRHIAYLRKSSPAAAYTDEVEVVDVTGAGRRIAVPRRPAPDFLQFGRQTVYQILGEVRWSYDDADLYFWWNWGNIAGKGISRVGLQDGVEEDLEVGTTGFEPLADNHFASTGYANACPSLPCRTGEWLGLSTAHAPDSVVVLIEPTEAGFSYAPSPDGSLLAYVVDGSLVVVTPDGENRGLWSVGAMRAEQWTSDGTAIVLSSPDGSLSTWAVSADGVGMKAPSTS
jgi:hypothetical protein